MIAFQNVENNKKTGKPFDFPAPLPRVDATGFEPAVSAPLRSAQSQGPQDLVSPLRPKRSTLPNFFLHKKTGKPFDFPAPLPRVDATGFEPAVSAPLRSAQSQGPQDLVSPLRPKRSTLPNFFLHKKTGKPFDFPAPLPRVDATGFEPATSASRTQRSTKLSHASLFCFL